MPDQQDNLIVTEEAGMTLVLDTGDGSPVNLTIAADDVTLNIFQGDLYFAQINVDLIRDSIQRSNFSLSQPQNTFELGSSAIRILSVEVNGLDYTEFCSLNTTTHPGRVTYTAPQDGYVITTGDSVIILWLSVP